MSTAAFWWNAIGLFLIVLWPLQRALPGPRCFLAVASAALVLCLFPFFGHPLRHWLSGLTPNVSVTLLALLVVSIAQRAGLMKLFGRREWRAAFGFGAVASVFLYASALGLGPRNFDSYSLGWPWLEWWTSLLFFAAVASVSAALIWRGNLFGWIPVLASAVYLLRWQESHNFWDYLIDPLYAVASLLTCLFLLVRRLLRC